MWGDPHISVGRRVERPIQCRKVAEASQGDRPRSRLSCDHSYLASLVTGAVRKEAIIIVAGARRADGDFLHSGLSRVLRDQGPEIDVAGSGRRLSRELLADLGAHVVAAAAYRRSQVDRKLVGRQAVSRQRRNCLGRDVGRCAFPTRMEQRHDSRRVGDEDRDAVGHAYGERDSLLRRDVPVCLTAPEPTFPPTGVDENARAMDLPDRSEASSSFAQLALHGGPPSHDFVDGIGAGQPECPGITGRGEGPNPPLLEIGNYFLRNLVHAIDGDRRRG
jgi:hypothetical protein